MLESNILVRDVMTKNVQVVREDTNLHEAVATLSKFNINSLVVVQGKRPVGIITTRDALIRAFEHGMPISSMTAAMVATTPVKTIDESATVEEAAKIMKQARIKHLPVISDGKLVGIITDSDIMFAVPKMLSMMEEVCRQK